MSDKIVLLDGHSILNRAFYGVPDLSNAEGLHTNAVYGFLNILFKILDEEQPQYLAVAFDLHAPTFRHKMYDGYKATRHGMPEELAQQMPVLKELLASLPRAGRRTTSLARWPLPVPPGRTTASLPQETGTACSWSVTPPPCCLPPLSWDAAKR